MDEVLAKGTKVVVAKGKKVLEFKLVSAMEGEERALLEKAVIGPSGNLRAPTARVGKTFLVGFNPEMWAGVLG